ncbi:MAG: TonB-dependent receptor [Ignavibacteriaceae bacterium]|nr:TonB-dependent receptor [Ignavibacteriaceae bacterium]
MNTRLFLLTISLFYLSKFTLGQEASCEIYGRVIDAASRQPLVGANIILAGTNLGTASDINGEFRLTNIKPNTYKVRVSLIGYNSITKTDVTVSNARPVQLDFELTEQILQLENIIVKADYFSRIPTEVLSVKNFSYEEIRRTPGGFEDVIRALSVLPGVAQAEPGRNDLVVRGGAPSENLYIVDGIEVSNINHFGTQGASGGSLSYINLDFVKETSFSTGGFSAKYGDKLSSILNISLRNGRNDRLGGKATISATQFGLNIEGPMSTNSNFIFSARRSYLDFIFKAAGFGFVPEYYDVLSKFNIKLNNENSLNYLFIGAFDNVRYFNETADQRFNNSRILGSDQTQYFTGLSWTNIFNKGFFDLTLGRNYIDFNTVQRDSLLNPIFQNKSLEAENSIRGNLIYKLSPSSELNAGFNFKFIKFHSDIILPTFRTSFGDSLPNTELNSKSNFIKSSIYVVYHQHLFERLFTNFGVRLDYFDPLITKFYLSPRLSVSYEVSDLTSLNFSTGVYHQAPSYIWLLADKANTNLKNVRADHFVLGIDHLIREDVLLKVEGFIKNYKNYPASIIRPYLVLANSGSGYGGSENNFFSFGLEPLTSQGKGLSRGIEVSVQKKLSELPYYGLMSLTLSKTNFTAIDGIEKNGSYDQTWIINFSGGYKFDEEWEASLKFRFASGMPYTPFNPDGSQNINLYNTERMKLNHSLDLRIDKHWYFDTWTLITYIDIQNIYNRKNSATIRWDPRTQSVDAESSIGILPSIGVSVEF